MNGKFTEWGMTYQKLVLMYCFMVYSNSYDTFQYEGDDDVVCINTSDGRKHLVQAKTGKLSEEDKKNIIYNWVKTSPTKNTVFSVFSIKGYRFDLQATKDNIIGNIKNAADADNASNIKKAYLACCTNGVFDENKAKNYLDIIIAGFSNHDKMTEQILSKDIFVHYKRNRIHDDKYVDSQIEKHIEVICEKYLKFIYDNIGESKNSDSPIVVNVSKVDEWIDYAKSTYGINGYNKRFIDFKENYSSGINENKREVMQLRKLGIRDNTILGFLIDEVFYKDFRSFYTAKDSRDIDSLEAKAFYNYEKASIGSNLTNIDDCLSVFKRLTEKTIEDPLIKEMSDSQYCSDGCYIYLSSDDANPEIQITWIYKNE